jgi:mannose-6-phosphate isomerase-like protein (cupin superfamily)
MPELERSHLSSCPMYRLPGRDWYYLLGPQNSRARNLAFGFAEFPAGTIAAPHTHRAEEEIIYIVAGHGTIASAEGERPLDPGAAVFIPPGLEHQIRVSREEPLKLVTVFSPPVKPGAYDPKKAPAGASRPA